MNFWSISLFVLALLEIVLLYYLYSKYLKTSTILYYILFGALVVFWVLENAVLASNLSLAGTNLEISIRSINLINRLTFVTGAFIATTFWLFSFTFPWPKIKLFPKYVLIAIAVPLVLSFFIFFTDQVVTDNYIKFGHTVHLGGNYYWVFIDEFLLFLIWGLINLINKYKESNPFYKKMIKLLLSGLIISGIIAVITHIIIPGLTDNTNVFIEWSGAASSVIWLIYTTRILMIKE